MSFLQAIFLCVLLRYTNVIRLNYYRVEFNVISRKFPLVRIFQLSGSVPKWVLSLFCDVCVCVCVRSFCFGPARERRSPWSSWCWLKYAGMSHIEWVSVNQFSDLDTPFRFSELPNKKCKSFPVKSRIWVKKDENSVTATEIVVRWQISAQDLVVQEERKKNRKT